MYSTLFSFVANMKYWFGAGYQSMTWDEQGIVSECWCMTEQAATLFNLPITLAGRLAAQTGGMYAAE